MRRFLTHWVVARVIAAIATLALVGAIILALTALWVD
jgi:hypothetical protein